MRLKHSLVLCLLAGLGWADTNTPRAGLVQPTIGSTSWGQKTNSNWGIIDSSAAMQAQSNIFISTNTFQNPVIIKGPVRFYDNSTHYIELQAPGTVSTTHFNLPTSDGLSGQCLSTDGAGNWAWATGGGNGGGNIISSQQYSIPFYSGVGSTNTLTGNPNIAINSASQILASPEAGSQPSYAFSSDIFTGINQATPGDMQFIAASAGLMDLKSSGVSMIGGTQFSASSITVQNITINGTCTGIGCGSSGSGSSIYPATATATFPFGQTTSTITVTSTATVSALSFSGGGNAQFSNDGTNYGQIVQSSAAVTVGHYAGFSSSWQVVDIGTGTSGGGSSGVSSVSVFGSTYSITGALSLLGVNNVIMSQSGNTVTVNGIQNPSFSTATVTGEYCFKDGTCQTTAAGAGGTPGGGSPQLQFNSTGTFAGVSGSYVTNSSITYAGAVAITTLTVISPGVPSSNVQGALIDVFSNTFTSQKPILTIGSQDVSNQFSVLNHFPVDMKNNGADIGCLEMAGHNEGIGVEGGIFERCAANAGHQGIYISNGFTGEMDLITATVANSGGGGTIYLQPNEKTEVAISTYGVTISTGLTVVSSATVDGMLAVIATTTTANMALISTSTVGGFGVDISTVGHFNVFNSSVTRGPTITNGTGDASCSDVACTINASASPVTFTFAKPFTKVPVCIVTEQTDSLVNALSYSKTATALTITQTGLSGNLDVICIGRD